MHNFSYEIGENYVELRSSIKIGNSLTSGLKSFKDLKNSIINNYMSFRLPIIYSMHEISRDVENCLGLQAQLSFYEDDNNQITFLTCFKYIVLRFCIFCIFFIVVNIDFQAFCVFAPLKSLKFESGLIVIAISYIYHFNCFCPKNSIQ